MPWRSMISSTKPPNAYIAFNELNTNTPLSRAIASLMTVVVDGEIQLHTVRNGSIWAFVHGAV